MNPIQVNCPGCQKLFLVKPEDLNPGEVRFQCTSCTKVFAFHWPQLPGKNQVSAYLLQDKKTENPTLGTKTCTRCGGKVDVKFSECPKCGVIFEKFKKVKSSDPVVKGSVSELNSAWERVKTNYSDEKSHEAFIQYCLSKENLAFASAQYRNILDGNPADDLANRMQNRIIDLATFSYISSHKVQDKGRGLSAISKVMLILGSLFVVSGFLMAIARPLMAVGASLLAFVATSRYMGKKQF